MRCYVPTPLQLICEALWFSSPTIHPSSGALWICCENIAFCASLSSASLANESHARSWFTGDGHPSHACPIQSTHALAQALTQEALGDKQLPQPINKAEDPRYTRDYWMPDR